jgi:hypothetical protein
MHTLLIQYNFPVNLTALDVIKSKGLLSCVAS